MIPFFNELFEYSHHYNQALVSRLLENKEKVSEKAMQLQSHIINAHRIWNSRILNEPAGVRVFDVRPLEALKEADAQNLLDTQKILREKDLSQVMDYVNSHGQAFSNTIRDVLFHVVNHSTYHRAQIATECKQNGIDPLTTDYIFYKR
jgi:uncharacterized damage-inducible protein DinB